MKPIPDSMFTVHCWSCHCVSCTDMQLYLALLAQDKYPGTIFQFIKVGYFIKTTTKQNKKKRTIFLYVLTINLFLIFHREDGTFLSDRLHYLERRATHVCPPTRADKSVGWFVTACCVMPKLYSRTGLVLVPYHAERVHNIFPPMEIILLMISHAASHCLLLPPKTNKQTKKKNHMK